MYAIYGIPFCILHDKTYTECLCTHFLEYKKLINIACYMFTLFSQVLQKNGWCCKHCISINNDIICEQLDLSTFFVYQPMSYPTAHLFRKSTCKLT